MGRTPKLTDQFLAQFQIELCSPLTYCAPSFGAETSDRQVIACLAAAP